MSIVLTSTPRNRFATDNIERTFNSRNILQKYNVRNIFLACFFNYWKLNDFFRAESNKPWIILNVVLTTLFAADVVSGQNLVYFLLPGVYFSIGATVEKCVLLLFCFNSLSLIYSTLKPFIFVSPISLTSNQMKLLGVNDKSRLFTKSVGSKTAETKNSPMSMDLSWLFHVKRSKMDYDMSSSSKFNTSSAYDRFDDSYLGVGGKSPQESLSETLFRLRRAKSCSPFVSSSSDRIRNALQLRRYLNKMDDSQKYYAASTSTTDDFLNVSNSSLPSPDAYFAQMPSKSVDFSLLVGQKYQVSPSITIEDSSYDSILNVSTGSSMMGAPMGSGKSSEHSSFSPVQLHVWLKFEIDPERVDLLTHNVRVWISTTVFKPILREIDRINAKLIAQHRANFVIGSSNLNSLQRLYSTQEFSTLAVLLPYLEMNVDQSFLVDRIRDLSRGTCLSNYSWSSSTTTSKSTSFNPQNVTDFDIVLHFLCVYLNAKMPSNPIFGANSSFTSQYFVKYPSKPNYGRRYLAVYRPSSSSQHLQVVYENDTYDVGKGSNNLFRSFLLFFQILKLNFDEHLGPLNLGPSGLNVLWTLTIEK